MPKFVPPRAEVHDRDGAKCVIYSGDLPDFPDWFEPQITAIVARLESELRNRREKENPAPTDL